MTPALKLLVTSGLLALAIHFLDLGVLAETAAKIHWQALALAVSLMIALFGILAVRWYLLICDRAPLPFYEHFIHYMYATFVNTFTPSNIGGDIYRAAALHQHSISQASIVGALLGERVVGVVVYLGGFIFCFGLLLVLHPARIDLLPGPFGLGTLIAVLGIFGYFMARPVIMFLSRRESFSGPRGRGVLRFARDAVEPGPRHSRLLVYLLSAAGLTLWICALYVIARNLDLDLDWLSLGAVAILVELLRILPVSIQGIGVREAGFAYLGSMLGAHAETGFITAAVGYLCLSGALIICGAIAAASRLLRYEHLPEK
jgi:glycosyltransferase 2 family protein